ncbi:MAG: CBS domain-containing protein, partial [Planctomycetales bacterium]|nr:CBS domain-containing protein [Planctomycetales bacterium]
MMTTVREILQSKGDAVYSIQPTETLATAVRQLNEHNCGSLVVCDGDQLVGILTERDILHAVADLEVRLQEIPVESRMTSDVVTGSLDDHVENVMGVMTDNRIRHLPIVET